MADDKAAAKDTGKAVSKAHTDDDTAKDVSKLEKRLSELEAHFAEWEEVLSSGDPVGNAQRVLAKRGIKAAK